MRAHSLHAWVEVPVHAACLEGPHGPQHQIISLIASCFTLAAEAGQGAAGVAACGGGGGSARRDGRRRSWWQRHGRVAAVSSEVSNPALMPLFIHAHLASWPCVPSPLL